jgi:hypothetical protein
VSFSGPGNGKGIAMRIDVQEPVATGRRAARIAQRRAATALETARTADLRLPELRIPEDAKAAAKRTARRAATRATAMAERAAKREAKRTARRGLRVLVVALVIGAVAGVAVSVLVKKRRAASTPGDVESASLDRPGYEPGGVARAEAGRAF